MCRSIAMAKENDEALETQFQKGVKRLYEKGIDKIPNKYILPVQERPNNTSQAEPSETCRENIKLPIIDFAELQGSNRPQVLKSLADACKQYGFFQLVNHGIPKDVIRGMVAGLRGFSSFPTRKDRNIVIRHASSGSIGTSFNQNKDNVFCWRDFLKLMCHPLPDVLPSLAFFSHRFQEAGGYLLKTNQILVSNDEVEGLQIQYKDKWVTVESIPNAFVVNVGDHLEIFSNGKYESVLHRVKVNSTKSRISVASLHTLPFKCMVRPWSKLIDAANPRRYKDTNFATFLDYISTRDPKNKEFLD
ncbi:hypothetical protein GH714_038871 [Hevea brasiliensis]|uniref:Fe2OG dioxygenase domain-containing protein n=1 Tax=Hevea brasiliensis TaxID=3981 RepID=A0A6A6KQX1_HEVBR|nr:hypothetical protein GH714_038871 [Hevea brasiliensis]